MADSDLLTPEKKRWSTWTILACFTVYLVVGVWQLFQERFLPRDSVELSCLDIIISGYSVCYGGEAFIRLLSAGTLNFVKKYGLKPSLLYVGFISVLSYVLVVYIMDWTAMGTIRFLQTSIVNQLENSVVEIEERRGPIKQRHLTGVVPYSIEEHTKYPGEDAVFECYRMVSYPSELWPEPDQVVWEKNGLPIRPSDHINISWTFENITDNVGSTDGLKRYLISSKLIITFTDSQDFGNYSCMMKNSARIRLTISSPKPKPPMCPLDPPPPDMCFCIYVCDDIPPPPPPPPKPKLELPMDKRRWRDKYTTVKVFSLVRMQELIRMVRAPPGGIVSFSATYDHLGEPDDISFDYTVGGKSFDSVCGGILNQCSFLVRIYWFFFHKGGHDMIFTGTFDRVRMQTAVTGTGWQSVCKDAYNYHEFLFYREIYNTTSGHQEIREVKYPHRVILAPRSPDLLFYNFTNTIDPLAKEPCWILPRKQLLVDYCMNEEALVDWTLWLFLHLESFVITTVILICIALASTVAWLLKKTVVIPVRNRILEGSFYPCRGCVRTHRSLGGITDEEKAVKHDVYISHADKELFSGHQLTVLLENSGLSVFFPNRDILGGQYKTEAISAAIASSRLFVVILSKGYLDSGMQNCFEFQHILKRSLEKTADYKKLLILKRENVHVPTTLDEFCRIDWTTNDNIDEKCRRLKNWSEGKVNRGQICIC